MKTKINLLTLVILLLAYCLLPIVSLAQNREVPFTLDDRDRIIQMQIKMDERFESINMRFESINMRFESQQRQLDDLKALFYWGFGIMLSLMLFLLGFIIWDRRTAMEPVRERTQSLIQSLREYAKEQPKLAEILRSHGLL